MSWLFDESKDCYVTLTDAAALTLPDGDWAIAGWVKLPDNTGTLFQYLVSWGALTANPSFDLYFYEASHATTAYRNDIAFYLGDDDTTDLGEERSSTDPGANTAWQHVIVERSGTTVTVYIDGASVCSDGDANLDAVNVAGNWYFGVRQDSLADDNRCLGGYLAEWCKFDRALTATEKQQLSGTGGYSPTSPADLSATSRGWYCPMRGDFTESWASLTVTNNDSQVVANSGDHPVAYAASGLSIPVAMHHYENLRRAG